MNYVAPGTGTRIHYSIPRIVAWQHCKVEGRDSTSYLVTGTIPNVGRLRNLLDVFGIENYFDDPFALVIKRSR